MAVFKEATLGADEMVIIDCEGKQYTLSKEEVEDALVANGQMCEFCLDEGEVSTDGTDSSGNIERGVNVQKCICKVDSGDDRSDDV